MKPSSEITIKIDAHYGSEFQRETATKALSLMLEVWAGYWRSTHKKNAIKVRSENLYNTDGAGPSGGEHN